MEALLRLLITSQSINKHSCHRQFLFMIGPTGERHRLSPLSLYFFYEKYLEIKYVNLGPKQLENEGMGHCLGCFISFTNEHFQL